MIARRRLASQFLLEPLSSDPAVIVRRLGAVQSQDYAGAKWALALRGSGITDSTVEQAYDQGRILRTHVMRPTWHFVDPADIRWLLELTGPRVQAACAGRYRELELDAAVFRRSRTAITRALRDGKALTKAELGDVLERARIDTTAPQRLVYLLVNLELDGLICSGPRRGKQATYALLEERVPRAPTMDRDAALGELAARYFETRGPATPQDFAWWSGLTVADAKRGIEAVGPGLQRLTIEGRDYWADPQSDHGRMAAPSAHLLPNYDEYFIGFRDRSAILLDVKRTKLYEGRDGLWAHIYTIDGQVRGEWKRTITTKSVRVSFSPVVSLTRAHRAALEREAARFGDFLGLPAELDFSGRATKR